MTGFKQDYHGLPKADVFKEYRDWMDRARKEAMTHFNVPVLSLSPFLGSDAGNYAAQYVDLKRFHNLDKLPVPRDVSRYNRKKTDNPNR